jgi:hypothetical protein
MNPWNLLGKTTTPGGDEMALMHRPGEHLILAGGKPLMSSRMHGSEEAMAEMACQRARTLEAPTVLVGGLGMGFTLRATLDLLPPDATVVVAELVEGVVEWNRGPLGHLADHPLKDRRVQVEVTPVDHLLRATKARFDVVLLDVDNGPTAFTTEGNGHQAGAAGVRHAGGVVGPRGPPLRAAVEVRRLLGDRGAGAGAAEERRGAPRHLHGSARRVDAS